MSSALDLPARNDGSVRGDAAVSIICMYPWREREEGELEDGDGFWMKLILMDSYIRSGEGLTSNKVETKSQLHSERRISDIRHSLRQNLVYDTVV